MRSLLVLILPACLSLDGKDHCFDSSDCLRGRMCGADGRCRNLSAETDSGTRDAATSTTGDVALYQACSGDRDCSTNLCVGFDALGGDRLCTEHCEDHDRIPSLDGTCSSSPPSLLGICASRSESAGGTIDVCLPTFVDPYLYEDPDNGYLFNLNIPTLASITRTDDVDLYFVELATVRGANVELTVDPNAGLDVAMTLYDAAFVPVGVCNGLGSGIREQCYHFVEADARAYVAVSSAFDTTGSYSILARYIPLE